MPLNVNDRQLSVNIYNYDERSPQLVLIAIIEYTDDWRSLTFPLLIETRHSREGV